MRRILLITLPIVLAVAAFWGANSLLQGPRYALYQIGGALKDGDAGVFLAYVDVPRIIASQGQAQAKPAENDQANLEDNLRRAVQGVLDVLVTSNPQAFNEQFALAMRQLRTEDLPSPWVIAWAANIQQSGDRALVVLADPNSGDRVRLGMLRQEGTWRVVHVDHRDVRMLLEKYGPGGGTGGVGQ